MRGVSMNNSRAFMTEGQLFQTYFRWTSTIAATPKLRLRQATRDTISHTSPAVP